MQWFFGAVYLALLVYVVVLLLRLVFDWIQLFARDWRPRGLVLVVAESVYTVTDPPLRLLRRVIPPIRFGGVQLDLGFMVLMFVLWFAMGLARSLASL